MKLSFLSNKRLFVVIHVLILAIIFILPLYLINYQTVKNYFFIKSFYIRTTIYVSVFYINYLWFIPKLLFKGRIKTYVISLLIVLAGFFYINQEAHDIIFKDMMRNDNIRHTIEALQKEKEFPKKLPLKYYIYDFLLATLLVTGLSMGLRVSERLLKNEKELKELEKEKLNSELAFLKNQVSPHFFFNTLNNIYSLIQINANDAQDSVLKLSKLMRYLLYESEKGNTMLSSELEFMHNYLDLMKLRLTDKIDFKVSFPEKYEDCAIQPLLFIPFIENAFKHGVSNRDHSFIHIALQVEKQKILFTCENSLFTKSVSTESDSGIGLENIKKRLLLLYPEKHSLKIDQSQTNYSVELKIETV